MLEMLWELFAKDEIPTFCNGTTFGNGKIRLKAEFNADVMESSVDVPEKNNFSADEEVSLKRNGSKQPQVLNTQLYIRSEFIKKL